MRARTSRPMWLLRRVAFALVVIVFTDALTFALIHAAPGDPVYVLGGEGGSAEYYAEMRAKYGLDRPMMEQFARYGRAVAVADFGYSFMYQAPVARVIAAHLLPSLVLGFSALTIATVCGFMVGALAGARPGGPLDATVRVVASLAYAAPVFWTGELLILFLALKLGILPAGGMTSAREDLRGIAYGLDAGRHLILPAITLALPFMALVSRVARAAIMDVLREPFILAASARGLSHMRVLGRHAARNALPPVIALAGEHAASVVAGAALTEAMFGWPGLGYLVLHASLDRDYPLVTASFIVISSSVVFFNAAADAACAWMDPRVTLT